MEISKMDRGQLIYGILGQIKGGYRTEKGLKKMKQLQSLSREELMQEYKKAVK